MPTESYPFSGTNGNLISEGNSKDDLWGVSWSVKGNRIIPDTMKLAIFSHGKESGPDGTKIKILRNAAEKYGFETVAPDYRKCANANERINLLRELLETNAGASIVLIGSSMGGYVSTVLSNDFRLTGLFLLCPALYMPHNEYAVHDYRPLCDHIEIVHGWNDEIVPYENSIQFARQTKAVLNLIADGHRLQHSHAFLENRFEAFLKNL